MFDEDPATHCKGKASLDEGWHLFIVHYTGEQFIELNCGDAFPIEGVLVATYLLSVEALPHCRCGVANKNRIV